MGKGRNLSSLTKTIWLLIIAGFAIMEFPGIYFINRVEPFVLGLPFIYGFTVVMWVFMCVVTFVAYKTNWGKGSDFVEGEEENDSVKGGNSI